MTLVAKRSLSVAGILALTVACQHDTVAPADTPVQTQTLGGALARVDRESTAEDGSITYVVRIVSHEVAVSSWQGTVRFAPGAYELIGKQTPSSDGEAYMLNTSAFADGRIAFAAFTTTTFDASTEGAEAFRFTVRRTGADSASQIDAALDVIGTETGTALRSSSARSSLIIPRSATVCAVPANIWGDANADDAVNVADAQQMARHAAGLSVSDSTALVRRGDVNGDGLVDIIDAQQIARFSIGLTTVPRVATNMPYVATDVVVTPNAPGVQVGLSAQLAAIARDENNADLSGCVVPAWSSSDASKATVDATGLLSGIAPGSATISVTVGGQTTQVLVSVLHSGPRVISGAAK